MFVTSSKYEQVVTSILEEEGEGELLVAVAFLGRGAESIFNPSSGRNIKLICNLGSGATNPDVVETLLKENGISVKQHNRLHAKVVVGNGVALVGSANFSSNGLNFEGNELYGWEEAGLVTRDHDEIQSIKDWFDAMWNQSQEIKDMDIKKAKQKWKKRRETRTLSVPFSHGFSIKGLDVSDLLDREIYVVIYTNSLSNDAIKAYRNYEEQLTGEVMSDPTKLPPIYEGWPSLPKDAQLIDLHRGPRGALRCFGVFTTIKEMKFEYSDGTQGHLTVCRKDSQIIGFPFRQKTEGLAFAKDLQPFVEKIWNSELAVGDEDAICIHLADIIKLCG